MTDNIRNLVNSLITVVSGRKWIGTGVDQRHLALLFEATPHGWPLCLFAFDRSHRSPNSTSSASATPLTACRIYSVNCDAVYSAGVFSFDYFALLYMYHSGSGTCAPAMAMP